MTTRIVRWTLCVLVFSTVALAAAKVHVIAFGKWMTVQEFGGPGGIGKPVAIKVRALMVDGRVKEYAAGSAHEVTDRLFVVRRAFRVNDELPEETVLRWQWQRGGWLMVDRLTGRVSAINLPEFDNSYSAASWYRDYVAYCGVGDDGKKTYAIVAQIGRRKPVLKKAIGEGVPEDESTDAVCPAPVWQRGPMRVSFEPAGGGKQTFAVRGHAVDLVTDVEEEDQ